MGRHGGGDGGRRVADGRAPASRSRALVLAAVGVAAVIALASVLVALLTSTAPLAPLAPSAPTTPLGCPTPVPAQPTLASAAQLDCTHRALVRLACDLDPDALTAVRTLGLDPSFIVEMRDPGRPLFRAAFSYQEPPLLTFGASLSCTIPAGGHLRRGSVSLTAEEWALVSSPGTVLPEKLSPAYLEVGTRAPASGARPQPAAPSSSSTDDACSTRAYAVFVRLARGEIDLARAQRELPAGVPRSALASALRGVRTYQADGLSRDEAINEAGGAVGQACPR